MTHAILPGHHDAFGGPVLVVGAGMVGASVAKALSRARVVVHVRDIDPIAARVASLRGAGSDADVAGQPTLVVVATPPQSLATEIAAALRAYPSAVVTDVGSVKSGPLADLVALGVPLGRYVGGHPMAGSERSGPWASSADLFEGRTWAVVRRDDVEEQAVEVVERLVKLCGGNVVHMSGEEHDIAVARVSHLPHVLAALTAARLQTAPPDHVALSGQGIRDVTRVAGGDPRLWSQIVAANAVPLTVLLSQVRADLDTLVDALTGGDLPGVEAVLRAGVAGTETIPGKHGGPTRPFASVTVTIPDQPGALARLFSDTSEAGVNIEDLRIDHDPGRAYGLVEIDVAEDQAERLVEVLSARDWSAHR